MRRILRVSAAATIMAVAMAAGIGPSTHALADTTTFTSCAGIGGGSYLCYTLNGAGNTTITPSGNEIDVFNGTESLTVYDANNNVLYATSANEHYQTVSSANGSVIQEQGTHVTETFTELGATCTMSIDIHYAHGNVQYNNFNTTC